MWTVCWRGMAVRAGDTGGMTVQQAELGLVATWIEDATWHRRGFRQSRLRWMPEHAVSMALRYTRGRVEHTSLTHAATLATQIEDLHDDLGHVLREIALRLRSVNAKAHGAELELCHALMGLDDGDLDWLAQGRWLRAEDTRRGRKHVEKAIAGLPWANPLNEAWELMQMRGLLEAALAHLENAFCDLTRELSHSVGWDLVGRRCQMTALTLRLRVAENVGERPEQTLSQVYPPMPKVRLTSDW